MSVTEMTIQRPDVVDGDIASLSFSIEQSYSGNVHFSCAMEPDEEVQDASDGDFPSFDCMWTVPQLDQFIEMLKDFRNGLEWQ